MSGRELAAIFVALAILYGLVALLGPVGIVVWFVIVVIGACVLGWTADRE